MNKIKPQVLEHNLDLYLNYFQWLSLKKKVDEEFNDGRNSYKEVRFWIEDGELVFESHCVLDRKRRTQK